MTNLSASSEDSGVSTGHKTHYGTMEDEKFFAENGRRRFQELPPDSPMTNGWHMDEDANMSFEFSTPMKKSSSKRKLSLDSDESASAMKKSKLAMTLLEGGKHGVIDGRWVCGECVVYGVVVVCVLCAVWVGSGMIWVWCEVNGCIVCDTCVIIVCDVCAKCV